jgi:hypothetical protein
MASNTSASNKTLSMKLLVNSKTQRVLYAEAGKDVVDFLFSLLTMPVGTAAKLLTADSMVGSVGNLYSSVEKLEDTYISCDGAKKALLTPAGGGGSDKLLQLSEPKTESGVLYRCSYTGSATCRNYVTKVSGVLCPNCHNSMTTQLQPLVEPAGGSVGSAAGAVPAGAGFVQAIVTYTVMDDLKVSPMSSISGITLLNTFGVTDIGSLKEKTVQLGYTEVSTYGYKSGNFD